MEHLLSIFLKISVAGGALAIWFLARAHANRQARDGVDDKIRAKMLELGRKSGAFWPT